MDAETFYNNLPVEGREEYEQRFSKEQFITGYNTLATAIDKLIPTIKKILKSIVVWSHEIMKCHPNKRLVHLAFHSKKGRTRKKNRRRIIKWLQEANNGA